MNELELLTWRIWEKLTRFNITDDERITRPLIRDWVIKARSTAMKELYREKRYIPEGFYTLIRDMKMNRLNPDSTKTREWYVEIPQLDMGIDSFNVSYFGPDDMMRNFSRIGMNAFRTIESDEVSGNDPYYVIQDGRALVKNPPRGIRKITMLAVTQNPVEINGEERFPIPSTIEMKIELLVFKDISSTFNVPIDIINDAADLPVQPDQGRRQ